VLAFLAFRIALWGVIELERKFEVYPIVSHETVTTLEQMRMTFNAFDKACEAHQAGQRDVYIGIQSYAEGFPYATPDDLVQDATTIMHAAVAIRKELAAQADWGLFKSMLIGGQDYTHSTWLCAPPYATFTTQINMGFTPTYDPPAS
jgi:hypothetical protein